MSEEDQILPQIPNVKDESIDFQTIFDTLPVAVYKTDLAGNITYLNPEAKKLCGVKPTLGSEYWCKNWMLYKPDGTPMSPEKSAMALALKEGKELSGEQIIIERPDGERFWVKSYPSLLRDDEGEIIGGLNMLLDVTDTKNRKERLQESEKKYRTLFESIAQGFSIVEVIFNESDKPVDLRFVKTNPAFETHTGVQGAEGKTITEIAVDIGKEIPPEWYEIMGKIVKTGKPLHFEKESEVFNRYYDVYAFPVGPQEDSKVAVLIEDISEPKKNELANARLGALVNNSEDAIISKDLNGIIANWNRAAESMFGYSEEEAIGQSINMLIPDDRRDEEKVIIERLKRQDRIHHFETVRLHKNGTPIHVSLSISPIVQNGKVIGGAKIARDITERKKAEHKLRMNRDRLRAALGINTVGVIFWDAESLTIKEVNDAFLEMSGYMREEAIGKSWQELTPKEFHPVTEKAVVDLRKTGKTDPYEKQYIRKDGSRWWGLFAPRIINEDEAVEFVLDISERKRNEQELQQLNEKLEEKVEERTAMLLSYQQQLRQLALELSKAEERERQHLATDLHDNMGQMLAVGKMKLESLGKQVRTPELLEKVEELKALMDESISYSRKLMTDLKPPPSLDKEDLNESICWLADKMQSHHLKVSVDDDGKDKELSDEVRSTVIQCVRELLFNVVKHAGVDKAHIDLSRPDGYIKISVEDEGAGFEFNGKQPAPTAEGGFGLFSIRERLNVIGGYMDIISKPGVGTKVILYIPVKNEEDYEAEDDVMEVNEQPSSQAFDGETESDIITKVLIVDDHRMMREGLRKMIEEEEDMTVIAQASDGEEAVEMAKEYNPDVIIMDVNMPRLNGMDATRIIAANDPEVRIIGLSFHEDKSVAEAMRKAGASAYLTKSDVFETLCATIRSEVQISAKQNSDEEE